MLYIKSCPRCRGDVHVDRDSWGAFAKCLQCGFSRDVLSRAGVNPPAPPDPETADDLPDEAAA
jgi:hypothetical protein